MDLLIHKVQVDLDQLIQAVTVYSLIHQIYQDLVQVELVIQWTYLVKVLVTQIKKPPEKLNAQVQEKAVVEVKEYETQQQEVQHISAL